MGCYPQLPGNSSHSMFDTMKTYLTAIDFSAITPKVVKAASELATATGSKLVILHVAEIPPLRVPVGYAMDVVTPPAPMEPPDLSPIEERLEQIASPLRAKGLSVETIALIGVAPDEILGQAKATHASMLIIGSHGHGALYQCFAGSVVTSVLHKSEIPVVVIPVHGK